jgi:anti-anti-sigma factor
MATSRMPHILNVYRRDTEQGSQISLSGEIDLSSAPQVRRTLAQCLHDGIRAIDVDLSDVTFCDCSGLNAFLYASLRTASAGGSLRLHHPRPALTRLFALTGSAALFHVLPGTLDGSAPDALPPVPVYESVFRLVPAAAWPAVAGGVL